MSDLASALRGLEPDGLVKAFDSFLSRTGWDSTDPEVQARSREDLDKMGETMLRDYPALGNAILYIAGKFVESGADDHSAKLLRTGASMLAFCLKERIEQEALPPHDLE